MQFTVRFVDGSGETEEFDSLADALADIRRLWLEDGGSGPQTFTVADLAGWTLAVLTRDREDPEIAHTLFADGRSESHRCRYIYGTDGHYLSTEVTRLALPGRGLSVADHFGRIA